MASEQTSINSEVPCCTEKTVLVAVYVEKPRSSRRFPSNHHDHELHHTLIKREVIQHKNHTGASYDRKAELLRYSRRLRDSASQPNLKVKEKPLSPVNQQPALSSKRKQQDSRMPDCLSSWKILNPRFLRSCANLHPKKEKRKKKPSGLKTDKIKSIVKRFEVRKNLGFVSKLLSKLQKRR